MQLRGGEQYVCTPNCDENETKLRLLTRLMNAEPHVNFPPPPPFLAVPEPLAMRECRSIISWPFVSPCLRMPLMFMSL